MLITSSLTKIGVNYSDTEQHSFAINLFIIYYLFYLKESGKIKIDDNVRIIARGCINPLSRNIRATIFVRKTGSLIIGDNVGVSSPCIWVKQKIEIGNNKIASLCGIIDIDVHSLNYQIRNLSI